MAFIILISTSELTPVCLMTITLDLNFVDIVGIRVESLVHLPNNNSQINKGSIININRSWYSDSNYSMRSGIDSSKEREIGGEKCIPSDG